MAHAATIDDTPDNPFGGGVRPFQASYGKIMMWYFLLSDAFTFTGLLTAYGFDRFHHVPNAVVDGAYIPSVDKWPVPEMVFDAFPFFGHGHYPLFFVGLMTFILIMSSVTMVLAVDAGHRMDKKAVEKWMLWTILGGITFLGCQAWEWMHFIHGSDSMVALFSIGFDGEYAKLMSGASIVEGQIVIENVKELVVMMPNGVELAGEKAALLLGEATAIDGANLHRNEYGPKLFADFFFFITGFHGTHVLSGVLFNILIFYNAATGLYQRRGHYEMIEKVGLYWHFVDLVWVFVFTFFYLI
jgi:cytochrome c oxidase subunit 3